MINKLPLEIKEENSLQNFGKNLKYMYYAKIIVESKTFCNKHFSLNRITVVDNSKHMNVNKVIITTIEIHEIER